MTAGSEIDVTDLTWKSPDWSRSTITTMLLPGGGVVWFDEDAASWYLDPAGSVPERLRESHQQGGPG